MADESPSKAMRRELGEELDIIPIQTDLIKALPGTATWKDEKFPILCHYFLVDIGEQELILNDENQDYSWVPLSDLNPDNIAFDSNQKMCAWLKENMAYDLDRIKELLFQLDPSAELNEQYLYRALLTGVVAKKYVDGKLVAFGWVFPRQTLLRKQAVVEDMIVDQEYRGKGYGKEILRLLIEAMRSQDIEVMELTTNPKREAANALYKSEGFWLHETNHYLKNL